MNDEGRAVEFQALIEEHRALEAQFKKIEHTDDIEVHRALRTLLGAHLARLRRFMNAIEQRPSGGSPE